MPRTFEYLFDWPRLICSLPVSADDQVKAYIKKIMSQLNKWMSGGKISKLVVVITDKETGEHVERWQFDVGLKKGFILLRLWSDQFLHRLRFLADTRRAQAHGKRPIRKIPLPGKTLTLSMFV